MDKVKRGRPAQGEAKTVPITIRVKRSSAHLIGDVAARQNRPQADAIREALADYFTRRARIAPVDPEAYENWLKENPRE